MAGKDGIVTEDTKTKLLQVAIQEFYEYGYNKSSLRRICQRAQVTTGALYFFFDNKDDLFESVISIITVPLKQQLATFYNTEQDLLTPSYFKNSSDIPSIIKQIDEIDTEEEDLEVFKFVFHAYFQNHVLFDIVLHNQTHPAVIKFMEEITALTEEHLTKLFQLIHNLYPQTKTLNTFAVHWLARMHIDSVLGLISQGYTEEEAIINAKTVVKILRGGFFNLL